MASLSDQRNSREYTSRSEEPPVSRSSSHNTLSREVATSERNAPARNDFDDRDRNTLPREVATFERNAPARNDFDERETPSTNRNTLSRDVATFERNAPIRNDFEDTDMSYSARSGRNPSSNSREGATSERNAQLRMEFDDRDLSFNSRYEDHRDENSPIISEEFRREPAIRKRASSPDQPDDYRRRNFNQGITIANAPMEVNLVSPLVILNDEITPELVETFKQQAFRSKGSTIHPADVVLGRARDRIKYKIWEDKSQTLMSVDEADEWWKYISLTQLAALLEQYFPKETQTAPIEHILRQVPFALSFRDCKYEMTSMK